MNLKLRPGRKRIATLLGNKFSCNDSEMPSQGDGFFFEYKAKSVSEDVRSELGGGS